MVQLHQLVKKAQKGNEQSFLTLFNEYETAVYRTAYIYVKNESDALDIVQETAYRSFKAIKNLNEPKLFKTWLIRITINCSLNLIKKQNNDISLSQEYIHMIAEENENDIDLVITIQDLIDQLNEEEKSIIVLRYYQGLTIKEVAETLKIPLGTAKTILYRALRKLRNELKGEFYNGK